MIYKKLKHWQYHVYVVNKRERENFDFSCDDDDDDRRKILLLEILEKE